MRLSLVISVMFQKQSRLSAREKTMRLQLERYVLKGTEPISLPPKCMKLRHVNTSFCLKSQFETTAFPVETGQSSATC